MCLCVCVCLSLAACPHYCTDPDVTWGIIGMPPSCALLGGFATGARVSLLWQHSAERDMSASACTRSTPGLITVSTFYKKPTSEFTQFTQRWHHQLQILPLPPRTKVFTARRISNAYAYSGTQYHGPVFVWLNGWSQAGFLAQRQPSAYPTLCTVLYGNLSMSKTKGRPILNCERSRHFCFITTAR